MDTCVNHLLIEANSPEGIRQMNELIEISKSKEEVFNLAGAFPPPEDIENNLSKVNDWREDNWGTRWANTSEIIMKNGNRFYVRFETRNMFPFLWLYNISLKYPELTFYLEWWSLGLKSRVIKGNNGIFYKKELQRICLAFAYNFHYWIIRNKFLKIKFYIDNQDVSETMYYYIIDKWRKTYNKGEFKEKELDHIIHAWKIVNKAKGFFDELDTYDFNLDKFELEIDYYNWIKNKWLNLNENEKSTGNIDENIMKDLLITENKEEEYGWEPYYVK